MDCGTFLQKTLPFYKPERGDMAGASVALNQMIQSTLTADTDLHWDLWGGSSSTEPDLSPHADARGTPLILTSLGDRVCLRSLDVLPDRTRRPGYVFVVGLPSVPQLSEWRCQMPGSRFPICGILHAANLPDLGWSYLRIALGIETCDVLVATSLAGKAVLEQIMATALDWTAVRVSDCERRIALPSIKYIPLGTNMPPESALDRMQARAILKIPQNVFAVLYLGRLTETYKADLDSLIMTLDRLAKEHKELWLILAGQTPEPSYVTYLRKCLGIVNLLDRTLMLENFPECVKSTILAASNVLVSPADSIQETFGLSILEAMAHAIPIVASD